MDILRHALKVLFDDRLLCFRDKIGKDLNRVLDVGTGTGIWAIEIADAHLNASVVGMDQSPIQPTWVPPNCEFIIHNAEEPSDFRNDFDLIHFRCMEGAFSNWVKVYREALDSLTRGGNVHVVLQDLWTYRANGEVLESIKSWMTEWNALMETIRHPTRIAKKHTE